VARSFLGAVVDHQGDPPGVAPPGGAVPDEKRTGGLWAGRREVGRGPPPVGRACGTEAAWERHRCRIVPGHLGTAAGAGAPGGAGRRRGELFWLDC